MVLTVSNFPIASNECMQHREMPVADFLHIASVTNVMDDGIRIRLAIRLFPGINGNLASFFAKF